MTDKELLQQALDALQGNWRTDESDKAIEALRAALAQPEPEAKKYTEAICPVCGYYCLGKGGVNCIDKPKLCGIDTAPPQREWQGLTDEEIRNEANHHVFDESFFNGAVWARGKIKEKNNG